MTCKEIENRLPAYLENLLSPEEQKTLTEHLASCTRCSRAFSDLKKAEQIVRGLEEVEPPPFFEQRIMSRVREEAGRRQGIIRRLFHPLHIKVPIQALATLLVAILAFYVYQTGDPEMKQMAPLPVPLAEHRRDQVKAESPKAVVTPSGVTPVKRSPAGDIPEKGRQRFAAPPFGNGGKEERIADSRVPIPEESPAAMKPADKVSAVKEKEVPPVSAGALSKARDKVESLDVGKTFETLLPEQKQAEKIAGTGAAARESRKAISAPSPLPMTAAAAIQRSVIDLTIQVRDTDVAIREIKERLDQVNALIIESQPQKDGGFLKTEIAAQNFTVLVDLLEEIGRINLEAIPLGVSDGNVTVNIKIVSHP